MKFLKTLTLSISLLAPVVTQAYVLDSNTNVVTDAASGKEWLQWTETTGMTIAQAEAYGSSYDGGGWRVASNADMAALYNDFFTTITWDTDENTSQNIDGLSTYGDGSDPAHELGTLFGWTYYADSKRVYDGGSHYYDDLYVSYALFGTDMDADGHVNQAVIRAETSYLNGNSFLPEYMRLDSDVRLSDFVHDGFGVALIRDLPAALVSKPGALALLGLGLAGLGAVRRKSKA